MAVTAAVFTVASTGASIYSQNKARQAEKESNAVGTAAQKTADRNAIKQKQREQLIRAAQIQQSASNTGVTGSSGELGSLGGLQTMYSGVVAQIQGQQNAADAITALNNTRSRYLSQASTYQGISSLAMTSYGLYSEGKKA